MSMKHVVMPKKLAKEYLFSETINDETLEVYYQQLQNEAYFAYLDTMLFALPKTKKVKTPILTLAGGKDKFFTIKQFEATAKAYKAPIKVFPNMSHDIMLEKDWELVAKEIADWCKQLKLNS